ncbi:MAG: SAM-dependent methyltransferase, partial [Erysipelotrichales bacterium]|nr:SAM-dependent methyltransferase [Erysipelotrichales bacterium]
FGPVIDVAGADLMDNTPIYDIKPYIVYADSIPEAKSGFATSRAETLEVVFPKELRGILPADKEKALIGVLAEDPRPHYQHDPKRIYGFPFAGHEIHFRAEEDRIILTGIERIKEE